MSRTLPQPVLARSALALLLIAGVARPAHAINLIVEGGGFVGTQLFSKSNRLGRDATSPPGTQLRHSGILGMRLGFVIHPRVQLEGELGLTPTSTRDGSAAVLAVEFRVHALFNLLTGRVRPFLLFGGGGVTSSSSNPDTLRSESLGEMYFGAGVAVDVACGWGLRADGRAEIVRGLGSYFTAEGELTASVYGRFGSYMKWKCAKKVPPPPPADTDKDGVVDPDDQCKTVFGPKENNGCPWPDSDGDGVIDHEDKCKDKAGPRENDGCPDTDTDGDGVFDRVDKCKDTVGIPEESGCPPPDYDNDGFAGAADKCPREPETWNFFHDDDGCPDEVPAPVKSLLGKLDGVVFRGSSTKLPRPATALLDRIADMMVGYPDIRLEIHAHTEDTGNADLDLAVSLSQAEAVRTYLVGHGVASTRLMVKAHGGQQPISTEKGNKGRTQNRRLEIHLQKNGP